MKKQTDSQRRNEAWENDKITREESKLATEMQRPISQDEFQTTQPRVIDEAQHETKAIARVSTFKQLAKISRSAKLSFGGTSQWIQPEKLFNQDYRYGIESVPFYVTKAFRFTSKQGYGERLGLEIVLSDGKMFLMALGLNEGDIKRNNLVALFEEKNAQPIGPFTLTKLPTAKGNDYYDLQPFESGNDPQSDEISFVAIDEDLPF